MKLNSRLFLGLATSVVATAFMAAMPAGAQNKPTCSDMSRDCLVAVARTYIEARADGRVRDAQRLAPDIRRWENGLLTATKPSEIAGPASGEVSKTLATRDVKRVLVDGDEAVFFWLLDRRDTPDGPYTSTVHLIERFKFAEGKACGDVASPCISEIEVVFCAAPHGGEVAHPPAREPNWAQMYLCNRQG